MVSNREMKFREAYGTGQQGTHQQSSNTYQMVPLNQPPIMEPEFEPEEECFDKKVKVGASQ